jgi:hypothetical protein
MFVRFSRPSAVLVAIAFCFFAGAVPLAADARPKPYVAAQSDAQISRYKGLATDALNAYKSGDMATAKAKSKELEKAWDTEQNALKAKSPDVWKAIDDAMDAFIKPLMKGSAPAADKVQAAYDDFIAKLERRS